MSRAFSAKGTGPPPKKLLMYGGKTKKLAGNSYKIALAFPVMWRTALMGKALMGEGSPPAHRDPIIVLMPFQALRKTTGGNPFPVLL